MIKDSNDKIQLEFKQVYDFIASLIRLSRNKDFVKEREKWDINPDIELDKWIDNTEKSLNKTDKNILNFFFEKKKSPGSGLIKYIFHLEKKDNNITINDFINKLKQIDENNLIYYFTIVSYNGKKELSPSLIAQWYNNNLYKIIEENFEVSAEEKWKIIKIFNEIKSIKQKLINFLDSYYKKYYRPIEEKIKSMITAQLKQNRENLQRAIYKGITELFSLEDNIFSFNHTLITRITYFGEFGDNGFFENNLFVVGYNYPQFINKVLPNQKNLEEQIHVLKALADKTRLKLLHELKNESKYMTELATKFEISNPSVDYHLKKFLQAGLIKIDKSENRIYYKIKKEKIYNLIELLKRYFDL